MTNGFLMNGCQGRGRDVAMQHLPRPRQASVWRLVLEPAAGAVGDPGVGLDEPRSSEEPDSDDEEGECQDDLTEFHVIPRGTSAWCS